MNRPRAAPTDSIARRPRTGPAIARPIGLLLASLAALASAGMLRAATPGAMTPPSATPLSARPLSAQPLSAQPLSARPLSAQGAVGRQLFMDTRLSNPPGTACVIRQIFVCPPPASSVFPFRQQGTFRPRA